LFAEFDRVFVSSGAASVQTIHTNTSDDRQFLLVVNQTQIPTATLSIQSDVVLEFDVVEPPENVIFQGRTNGGSLSQQPPQIPVRPDDFVQLTVINESSSQIQVESSITLRRT
jgi:hypothetical protein